MPARPKHDTLSRLLELLKALPARQWATASELRQALVDRGYEVDLRSVQRDLKDLQRHFPIEQNDKGKPHGWRWSGQGAIAGMSTPEALALVLVQQHLQAALPATLLEGFVTLFERAHERLDRLAGRAGPSSWPDKIKAVAPGLGSLPPTVDSEVHAAVSQALLDDRQLRILYAAGAAQGQSRRHTLHPLGLVVRGPITYLVASRDAHSDPRHYALHRIRRAEVMPDAVDPRARPRYDQVTAFARGQFGVAPGPAGLVSVSMACVPSLAAVLEESPLSADQRAAPGPSNRIHVTATLPDSWELRWWLLGRGAQVEVLSPADLRDEVAATLAAAARLYKDDAESAGD